MNAATGTNGVFRSTGGDAETVLYNRDCLAGMAELVDPKSIDVVVTSPPYNLGIAYGTHDDAGPRAEYLDWMEAWADEVLRVLSRQGSLFLNLAGKPTEPWGPFEVIERLRSRFVLQNTIHWIKSIAIDTNAAVPSGGLVRPTTIGHYKPISSGRFVNDCHEYIFHLTRTGTVKLDRHGVGVPYRDKTNVRRWVGGSLDLRCRGNTWLVPYRTIRHRDRERPHPATFPARIPIMCCALHGRKRIKRVMDPFTGIGASALAAKGLGTDFVGFEIDPGYFAEACRRVAGMDADKAITPTPARNDDLRPGPGAGTPETGSPAGRTTGP